MHHVVLDRWGCGSSPVHRRDPRAKILAALIFLVALATAHHSYLAVSAVYFAVLVASILVAGLPPGALLQRAALVLPFSLVFAAMSVAAGDPTRAISLVVKSYLSALVVLVLVSTTPLPQLLRGLERMAVPRFLLLVVQFLYRYLFVISEEAQHMRAAALAKAGSMRRVISRRRHFGAAAGAVGVLFARSYARAEQIHLAMLARGFAGHFRPLAKSSFRKLDAAFLIGATAAIVLLRAAIEVWT